MAKRKVPTKRGAHAKGVRGMTPKEVAAWRKSELRERAKEKAARQELERAKRAEAGRAKRGRPKGKKRLTREAEKELRSREVAQQQAERRRRSRAKGKPKSTYRKGYARELGLVERRRTRRGGVEKTLFRFKGVSSGLQAVDALLAMPKGTSALVQLGAGYQQGATWVGSRTTSPQDAALWLQGIGLKYAEKIFGQKADPEELFIEVIGYRRYGEDDDYDDEEDDDEERGSNDSFSLGARRSVEGGTAGAAGGGAGRSSARAGGRRAGAARKAGVSGGARGKGKAGGRSGGKAGRRKGR